MMPPGRELDAETQRFHAHLDWCDQCRNYPLLPCWTGAMLLRLAALKAVTSAQQGAEANRE